MTMPVFPSLPTPTTVNPALELPIPAVLPTPVAIVTAAPTAAPQTSESIPAAIRAGRRAATATPAPLPAGTAAPETTAPDAETSEPENAEAGSGFLCCLQCAGNEGRCRRWLPVTGRTIEEAQRNTEFTFVTKGIVLLCAEKTARCRERPAAP
jgi:hypothetical protein